ncbi:MAG TPA: metallopeptidase TldD-related protein [Bryobacteraceae bacterium]|nr:metallopeptidase TldD-related protein [Bryobacteraceae bacterium]
MRDWIVYPIWAVVAAGLLSAQPADKEKDIVLKAMKDELARSRSLRVIGEPPYYIEYTLDDAEMFYVSASYGGVLQERNNRLRQPRVRIRVGEAKLDNSNHISSDAFRGSRYDPGQFAIEDNYDVLRMGFWLATDRAYKQGLEALARKKASLKNINVSDTLPDFSAAPPVSLFLPVGRKPADASAWRARVKEISAVFSGYEQVLSNDANVGVSQTVTYFINSEGSEFRMPDNLSTFRIRAAGLGSDGLPVRDYAEFLAVDAARLPGTAESIQAATRVAENIKAMATAPSLESYSGPVLFEDSAGGQIMAELIARNLSILRRPITDPDRPLNLPQGELEGRLGSRVLPEWLDVVDDPTQKEWRGIPLLGYYPVDMEGVVPKALPLVEKGVLKAYYTTRQPIQGVETSNGHARLPGILGNNSALAANLFVKSSQPAAVAELRKRLLEIGKQRSKPFVIVVRKMDFPSTASLAELRSIGGGQQGRAISRPLMIYKLFPDGREELIRGVRFRGFNVRSLKDIVAASDDLYVFHYLENGAPFAHMDAGGYVAGTSVVAPALLFDDLELEKIPGELPKPPVVPPPPLNK